MRYALLQRRSPEKNVPGSSPHRGLALKHNTPSLAALPTWLFGIYAVACLPLQLPNLKHHHLRLPGVTVLAFAVLHRGFRQPLTY